MDLNMFVLQIRNDLKLHRDTQDIYTFSCGAGKVEIHQLSTTCE